MNTGPLANPITRDDKFIHLMEAAPDAMVIINSQRVIVLVNSQLEKMFGWTRAELQGQSVDKLVPQRFRDKHGQHRAGYFSDLRVRPMGGDLDLLGLRRDGSEFPVEISLSPLGTEGDPLVIAAVRDITDRRRADEQFRGLLESAPDAVVVIDEMQIALDLAQDFAVMLRKRLAERLDTWLERAANSALPAFHGFVAGLRRDYSAVKAGLSLPWSQGQSEGQVNRLKFLKRQSFGRANFDPLRLRVLFEG